MNVWAAAGDCEALDGREGETQIAGRQEGELAGNLSLPKTIPALLFALLTDNGCDKASEAGVAPAGKDLYYILECAEDEIGERASEDYGRIKVRNRKRIGARFNGLGTKILEAIVRIQGMELLLLFIRSACVFFS